MKDLKTKEKTNYKNGEERNKNKILRRVKIKTKFNINFKYAV